MKLNKIYTQLDKLSSLSNDLQQLKSNPNTTISAIQPISNEVAKLTGEDQVSLESYYFTKQEAIDVTEKNLTALIESTLNRLTDKFMDINTNDIESRQNTSSLVKIAFRRLDKRFSKRFNIDSVKGVAKKDQDNYSFGFSKAGMFSKENRRLSFAQFGSRLDLIEANLTPYMEQLITPIETLIDKGEDMDINDINLLVSQMSILNNRYVREGLHTIDPIGYEHLLVTYDTRLGNQLVVTKLDHSNEGHLPCLAKGDITEVKKYRMKKFNISKIDALASVTDGTIKLAQLVKSIHEYNPRSLLAIVVIDLLNIIRMADDLYSTIISDQYLVEEYMIRSSNVVTDTIRERYSLNDAKKETTALGISTEGILDNKFSKSITNWFDKIFKKSIPKSDKNKPKLVVGADKKTLNAYYDIVNMYDKQIPSLSQNQLPYYKAKKPFVLGSQNIFHKDTVEVQQVASLINNVNTIGILTNTFLSKNISWIDTLTFQVERKDSKAIIDLILEIATRLTKGWDDVVKKAPDRHIVTPCSSLLLDTLNLSGEFNIYHESDILNTVFAHPQTPKGKVKIKPLSREVYDGLSCIKTSTISTYELIASISRLTLVLKKLEDKAKKNNEYLSTEARGYLTSMIEVVRNLKSIVSAIIQLTMLVNKLPSLIVIANNTKSKKADKFKRMFKACETI